MVYSDCIVYTRQKHAHEQNNIDETHKRLTLNSSGAAAD